MGRMIYHLEQSSERAFAEAFIKTRLEEHGLSKTLIDDIWGRAIDTAGEDDFVNYIKGGGGKG